MDKFHKVFKGRAKLSERSIKEGMITGGAVALEEKLRANHGWNGASLLAAPIVVLENGAIVDTHWAVMGKVKDVTFSANFLWQRAEKELKVAIRVPTLTIFDFAVGNISNWLNREELEVIFTLGEEVLSHEQAVARGAGEFCIRALVCPTSHTTASLWIGAHPRTRAALEASLGANHNSNLTPHITLQLSEVDPNGAAKGRAATARLTRQEQAGEDVGFGVIPWIDVTAEGEEDAVLPDSDDLKEAVMMFMRKSASSATATTAAAVEQRVRAVVAGTGIPPKGQAFAFPPFEPAQDPVTAPARTGQWRFPSQFPPFRDWASGMKSVRTDFQMVNDLR